MRVRVTRVVVLDQWKLELGFSDGSSGCIDFRGRFEGRVGLFEALADPAFFRRVTIDPEAGTLVWPNGLDLCPDVLRHDATGAPLPASRNGADAA
ncbi:MAG: DUF2442 domain-containing protein [Deltaproteobacteria bacterium]|nr:DUF2442 domain-containing protein [Deltaproteobacteria bacterium]